MPRLRDADAAAFAALLGPAPPPSPPVPVALPGGLARFAVTLAAVLAPDECARLVAATEARGYGRALLNVGNGREVLDTATRDSARVVVDAPELADALFARVAHALPAALGGGAWRLVGLNERLRFLRYDVGEKFAPHHDGYFERDARAGALAGQRTHVTLLLYLNAGYEGCATTFYDETGAGAPPAAVAPAPGLALLHEHRILHAAPPLVAGRKYVVRTDVLYERVAVAAAAAAPG